VRLAAEPTRLQGGATLPTSLFRDPQMMKVRDHNKFNFRSPDDATQPTDQSRDSPFADHTDNPKILGYKSLHYEHMTAYIQKQEYAGNIIKMP
jgi:hypothetical protein